MKTTYQIDQEAQIILRTILPSSWLFRKQDPDWYIDFFIEVTESDRPIGLNFAVQLKGSESLNSSKAFIKFRLETKYLRYYLDKARQPVFLIVAEIKTKTAYWLFTQRYLREKKDDAWRSKDKITLYIPRENNLTNLNNFRNEIISAESYMRDSWTSSIASAISHRERALEQLDPRFSVSISANNDKEVYTIKLKENVVCDLPFKIKNTSENQILIKNLFEKGNSIVLSSSDFEIHGSEIFQKLFGELTDVKLHIEPYYQVDVQLNLSIIDQMEMEISSIYGLIGKIRSGLKEAAYAGHLPNSPLKVYFSFSLSNIIGKTSKVTINFDISIWEGQPILQLPYFDRIYDFFRKFNEIHQLKLTLEYQGNFLLSGRCNQEFSNQLANYLDLLHILYKARTIAKYLRVNPQLPAASDFFKDERIEEIEILYNILIHGEHRQIMGIGEINMTLTPDANLFNLINDANNNKELIGDILLVPEDPIIEFLGQSVNIGIINFTVTNAKLTTPISELTSYSSMVSNTDIKLKWQSSQNSEIIRTLRGN